MSLAPRKYGLAPYKIVLVHGGPGAPGGLAPLAKNLAPHFSILEPFQNAGSIDGQIEELSLLIKEYCSQKVILIGHSWGAWLAWMFTSKYPALVKKLILIGAGPFEEKFAGEIMQTRLRRLNSTDRIKVVLDLMNSLQEKDHPSRKKIFKDFGILMTKVDTFEAISDKNHVLEFQPEFFDAVWPEAKVLRESGELLEMGKKITCPVIAFHGDYDPHPAEGVEIPLSGLFENFKTIKMEKCGHSPWNEKFARERFFEILCQEIG